MNKQHIHVKTKIDTPETPAPEKPVLSELDVDADGKTLTPDGQTLPTKTSSIDLIRGRLGRKIVSVTFEVSESGEVSKSGEFITIELKQMRPAELMLLAEDRLPVLRSEYPDFAAHVDKKPLPAGVTPGSNDFWKKIGDIDITADNDDEDASVWEAIQFMHRYQAEIVSEAVIDKRINLELLLGFPQALLQTLYEVATGSFKATTVDNFSEVDEEAGKSE